MEAITSSALSPQAVLHLHSGESNTQKHAYVKYNPRADYYCCSLKSGMWEIAKLASILAKVVIPLVAAVLIGGALGVIAGFGFYALLEYPVALVKKYTSSWIETIANQMKFASAILEKMNAIADTDLQGELRSLGIKRLVLPENEYKSLLARHALVSEKREKAQTEIRVCKAVIQDQLAKAKYRETPEERKAAADACETRRRLSSKEVLCAKLLLEEAYLLYVMHCPTSARPRSDFFKIFERDPRDEVMGALDNEFFNHFLVDCLGRCSSASDVLYFPTSERGSSLHRYSLFPYRSAEDLYRYYFQSGPESS